MKQDIVLQHIIKVANRALLPKKIILFGSRARGDFKPTSDYDLAFEIDPNYAKDWTNFFLDVNESNPTLYKLDLVDLSKIDEAFKARILSEGKIIYENKR